MENSSHSCKPSTRRTYSITQHDSRISLNMDEQVLRSLIKWPSVPECKGWLALDRRGIWRMRNEFAQANHLAGEAIKHEGLIAFIERTS